MGTKTIVMTLILVLFMAISSDDLSNCASIVDAAERDACFVAVSKDVAQSFPPSALDACDEVRNPDLRDGCITNVAGVIGLNTPRLGMQTCNTMISDESNMQKCYDAVKPGFNLLGQATFYYYTDPTLMVKIVMVFPFLLFLAGVGMLAKSIIEEDEPEKGKAAEMVEDDELMSQYYKAGSSEELVDMRFQFAPSTSYPSTDNASYGYGAGYPTQEGQQEGFASGPFFVPAATEQTAYQGGEQQAAPENAQVWTPQEDSA
jgi:hypothetical protein